MSLSWQEVAVLAAVLAFAFLLLKFMVGGFKK